MHAHILTLALLVTLTGCAQTGLYKWGGYEQKLYATYKDPSQVEKLRLTLEAHIAEMEGSGQKVAPGLYAELGTIYLQAGASDKAIAMYAKERNAWPESRGLMTAMIQNLERREKAKQEAAK
ncbi:MAG: DUF4810 domain-containing protein [Hydrogenophilales bacterium 28-61-23]|nr:MAG: DUF4810 domain-containing protein [Hydrogenophilales bacterium 28-61-23]